MLAALVQTPSEITNSMANSLVESIRTILSHAATTQVPYAGIKGLTPSLSSLPTTLVPDLPAGEYQSNYYDETLRELLFSYAAIAAADVAVDESVVAIESKFRIVTTSFFTHVGLNMSAPRTATEVRAAAWIPQYFLYNAERIAPPTDFMSVSLLMFRTADFQAENFNSNPVRIFYHQRPFNYKTGKIEVTLQNIDEVDILKRPTQNYTTMCYNRRPLNYSYPCPGGFPNITVSCLGTAGTIFSRCPFYFRESICSSTERDLSSSATCQRLSYDEYTTVCACSSTSLFHSTLSSGRNLQASGSGSEISLTAKVPLRYTTFPPDFTAADPPVQPERLFTAPATMATVGGMFGLLIFLMLYTDKQKFDLMTWTLMQSKKVLAIEEYDDVDRTSASRMSRKAMRNGEVGYKSARAFGQDSVSSRNWSADEELGANGLAQPLKFVLKNALPAVFQVQNFFASVFREMKVHHRWLSVALHYSANYSRLARLATIVTHINLMLLSNFLIIVFVYSAGSHCKASLYEEDCLSEMSIFDPRESRCQWDSFYNTCNNHVPRTSAFSVVSVVCLAQLMCLPFLLLVDYVIRKISSCNITGFARTPLSTQSLTMARAVLQASSRAGFNLGGNRVIPAAPSVRASSLQQEMLTLESAVNEHLGELDVAAGDVFLTRMYGYLSCLDGYKQFVYGTGMANSAKRTAAIATATSDAEPVVETEKFHAVLTQLADKVQREQLFIESLDEEHRASYIFRLFVLDLLPEATANVVIAKAERDNAHPWSLTYVQVVSLWAAIAAVNVAAFVVTILYTLEMKNEKQLMWLNCFMFWLCFEPFLVDTLYVLAAHLYFPSRVVANLQIAKAEVGKVIDAYMTAARRKESKINPRSPRPQESTGFNFAPYFMLSLKVAKLFPDMRESRIVRSFCTGKSVLAKLFTAPEEVVAETGLLSSIKRFFSQNSVFDTFVSMHVCAQDVVLYASATVGSALICILHIVLYNYYAPLLVVPVAICLILMATIVMINYKRKISQVSSTADLTLMIHDDHFQVIDLVDTSRSDIMQSKFFKDDGVHDLLTPVDAEVGGSAEHKTAESFHGVSLHVIGNPQAPEGAGGG
jgi:hypothetical protein